MIRWLWRLAVLVGIVYAATLAFVVIFAATFENPDQPPRADLIVCLGGGAYDDGSLALSSAGRAIACADLFALGGAKQILFTGANGDKTVKSIAAGMADLAKQHGVPEAAILLEEESRSTLQNALFSAPQMAEADTIILVTQGFHLARSKISFQVMGPWEQTLWMSEPFDRTPDGSIHWWLLHREAMAFWFNLGRYGLWKAGKTIGLDQIDWILA